MGPYNPIPGLGLLLMSQSLSDHLCPKHSFLKALSNPKWAPGLLTTQTSKPSLGDALPLKGITLIAA